MGLDMYAYKASAAALGDAVVGFPEIEGAESLFYWRKHPNLHGWMEALYRKKGGTEEFNCEAVRLVEEDLDALERAVMGHGLPDTTGFFFGRSEGDEEERAEDLLFISKAREALAEGWAVYYSSWW